MTIKAILLDIEGTTTDIQFVHKVLFPYAAKNLRAFVENNLDDAKVRDAIAQTKQTVLDEQQKTIDDTQAIDQLLQWIKEDRKHTALKALQGMIWKQGYENGDYQSHIYDDVVPAFKRWKDAGLTLAIYSSGSVQAQKLLFQYTPFGDLTPNFAGYFDTTTGPKKEASSYAAIANALNLDPPDVLFLSDHPDEIAAAHQAGCAVVQLLRDGQEKAGYPAATTFDTIDPLKLPQSVS